MISKPYVFVDNCNFEKNENNHFDLNISLVKKNALYNYFKLASS